MKPRRNLSSGMKEQSRQIFKEAFFRAQEIFTHRL